MPDMGALSALIRRSAQRAQPMAAAYAEGNMTCLVTIFRPAKGAFDRDSGQSLIPDAAVVTQDCPAHIYTVTGGQQYSLGDEPVYTSSTYASIPLSRPRAWINDELEVLDAADAQLIGQRFKVISLDSGGMIPACHRLQLQGMEAAPNLQTDRTIEQ